MHLFRALLNALCCCCYCGSWCGELVKMHNRLPKTFCGNKWDTCCALRISWLLNTQRTRGNLSGTGGRKCFSCRPLEFLQKCPHGFHRKSLSWILLRRGPKFGLLSNTKSGDENCALSRDDVFPPKALVTLNYWLPAQNVEILSRQRTGGEVLGYTVIFSGGEF